MTPRDATPFEAQLQELLDRISVVMSHDTDRMQQMAALQGRVYAEVDAVLRRYIRERDQLMAGYATHGREAGQ